MHGLYGYYGYGGGALGWIGPLLMVFFWVLIAVTLVFAIRYFISKTRRGAGSDDDEALKILRERFAKGEIDKAEFEEKKKVLG